MKTRYFYATGEQLASIVLSAKAGEFDDVIERIENIADNQEIKMESAVKVNTTYKGSGLKTFYVEREVADPKIQNVGGEYGLSS